MDQIEIKITMADRVKLELISFPELTSEHKLVRKGLIILKQYLPNLMNYISKQRIMGHMPVCQIVVKAPAAIDSAKAHNLLEYWLKGKKNRRLLYIVIEIILMPFSAFVAILPGPNVVFYLLFVLFYFHLKTFISLRKIDIGKLDITLETI